MVGQSSTKSLLIYCKLLLTLSHSEEPKETYEETYELVGLYMYVPGTELRYMMIDD